MLQSPASLSTVGHPPRVSSTPPPPHLRPQFPRTSVSDCSRAALHRKRRINSLHASRGRFIWRSACLVARSSAGVDRHAARRRSPSPQAHQPAPPGTAWHRPQTARRGPAPTCWSERDRLARPRSRAGLIYSSLMTWWVGRSSACATLRAAVAPSN